jgi:hypothetical protein
MKKSKYNLWFALTYEILTALKEHYKKLRSNKWVKLILAYCKHDWVLWKVESTLKSVDRDIEKIQKQWEAEQPPKFIIVEHEPNGSEAQKLLGGAIEIKSTFKRE